jgi:hypothetical protein
MAKAKSTTKPATKATTKPATRKAATAKAAPAPVVPVLAAAKLTRRNATPSNAVLVLGPTACKTRAAHNAAAWAAVQAALPAPAAVLAALPVFTSPNSPHFGKLNGPVWVSYAQRNGWLATK